MRVLVTRPSADSTRTAALLEARGHASVISPVTAIVARPFPAEIATTPGLSASLATSAHAFEGAAHWAEAIRALPVYCVGWRTAEAATAAGFGVREPAEPDAAALANRLAAEPTGQFLYLAGADRKPHLERALAAQGHHVALAVTYEAVAVASLPPIAKEALASGGLDAVLHYSRRHADLFKALTEAAGLGLMAAQLAHICLSMDVAEPLQWVYPNLRIAEQPDEQALMAALEHM